MARDLPGTNILKDCKDFPSERGIRASETRFKMHSSVYSAKHFKKARFHGTLRISFGIIRDP